MWNRCCWLVVATFLFISCGSKKRVVSNDIKTSVVVLNEGFSISNLDFRTFNGRAKTRIEFGDDKQDMTLYVRIDRDKAIWISVAATLVNHEVARVLITPDTVKIMNKMQSEYMVKPFNYIHKYTGEGVDFSILQDLLVANVNKKLLRTTELTVASAEDDMQLAGVNDGLSFQYSLNENKRPKVFRLHEIGKKESLESFYSSFAAVTGYNFPQNQNINLNASYVSVKAIVNYNKLEFNELIEMPFVIPDKYRRID